MVSKPPVNSRKSNWDKPHLLEVYGEFIYINAKSLNDAVIEAEKYVERHCKKDAKYSLRTLYRSFDEQLST